MRPSNKSTLGVLSQLESSGGIDTDHPQVQSGPMAGQTAYGKYGLMPSTVRDLAKANPRDEVDKAIMGASDDEVNQYLKDYPEKEDDYASRLVDKIKARTGTDDPKEIATSWLYGHNLPPQRVEQDLDNHPEYEQRIDQAEDLVHGQSEPADPADELEDMFKKSSYSKVKKYFTPNK